MVKKIVGYSLLLTCLVSAPLHAAEYSDTARFVQGFSKIITAPFYAPVGVLKGIFTPFPPVGVISGALAGTYQTVTGLMSGLWDIAGAAAPYAKYALLL